MSLKPYLSSLNVLEISCFLVFGVFCSVAWVRPRFANNFFSWIERLGTQFAARKKMAFLVLALAVPLVRLPLLAIMPVPVPGVADEFSYLLAADTFAHGRLTNPPHPMRDYLEAIHINQLPTYMSKYPPAQGAVLAIGQLLGQPWLGVVLSMSLMCAAILWMLYGWLPARWAFLGAALIFLRLGIFSYWINSYWGGAVPALGGALVTGALPRLFKRQKPRDAFLMGLGVAILVNSRPFEGLIVCLPVAVALAFWLLSSNRCSWQIKLSRVCVPTFSVLLLTAAFGCYFNWRGTGNPLLLPYQVNDRTYLHIPLFMWQKLGSPLHYATPHLEDVYNNWARPFWLQNRFALSRRTIKFIYFFLWPEFCLLFLVVPRLLGDKKLRLLLIQFLLSYLGILVVVWFQPHYAAPLLATICALVVQAMRYLRRWCYKNRPVGVGLTRAIVLFSVAMCLVYAARAIANPRSESLVASRGVWGDSNNWTRAEIQRHLESLPGTHLVVIPSAFQPEQGEWIYNQADIDHSKIVWARDVPAKSLLPLLQYYRSRHVWLLVGRGSSAHLTPYLSQNANLQGEALELREFNVTK